MDPCKRETARWLKGLLERLSSGPQGMRWVKEARRAAGRGETILVFPASFNPPTKAHLYLLEKSRGLVRPQETAVVLDHHPMDKDIATTTLDRLLMLLKLFEGDDALSLALAKEGLFLAKLRALRRERPGAEVVFLMGWDTLLRLFDPRYYTDPDAALRELFAEVRVMAALRGEVCMEDVEQFLKRGEVRPFAGRITVFEVPEDLRFLSSTEVRKRVRQGQPIEGLVPRVVEEYIRKRGLYR